MENRVTKAELEQENLRLKDENRILLSVINRYEQEKLRVPYPDKVTLPADAQYPHNFWAGGTRINVISDLEP